MKKFIYLILIMTVWVASCNPYGSQISQDMVGNYINPHTGEWKYGLFEEFAIYSNDFWDYESITDSEIVISNKSGKKSTLTIQQENDTCLIVNGEKVVKYDEEVDVNMYRMWPFVMVDPHYAACDGIKPDSSSFKNHEYKIDTAVVRLYMRNTAKGIRALNQRDINYTHYIQLFNYLEAKSISAKNLYSTDHYGYCFEYKIPVTGVSELPISELLNHSVYGYNSYANKLLNYVVEPNDTLMFYVYIDNVGIISLNGIGANTLCSGTNGRFNTEKNALMGMDFFPKSLMNNVDELVESKRKESLRLQEIMYTKNINLSEKFKTMVKNKMHYIFLNYMCSLEGGLDSIKNFYPFNEEEIFSTTTAFDFVCKYFSMANNDTLSCNPENLALHPDWIITETSDHGSRLKNPQILKDMGFSDNFIEFFRLMHAVQFYDDFSVFTGGLKDFELHAVMNQITKPDYKAYLEDKIKEKHKFHRFE
ncbi:MAG: hypothetical protein J6Y24_03770 [Bacteroidales bacterium]|nr:hypothetical protein [Bacteroidales bacterium]